jgi:phosphoglycerol geranylgeranyltransferase
MNLLYQISSAIQERKKSIILLIDPDKYDDKKLIRTLDIAVKSKVSFILVGGSLVNSLVDDKIKIIKEYCNLPVFLFPGSIFQLSSLADGIFFLSLISGRNPEYLIGNHIHAAPFLQNSGLEIIPVGYMLIDTGKRTSVEYISNTNPIPADKPDIAIATALAGEMLGMKLIYLEGGSGAGSNVNLTTIKKVKENIHIPLIVGGGIKNKIQATEIFNAGADCIVIGNAVESEPDFLFQLAEAAFMY